MQEVSELLGFIKPKQTSRAVINNLVPLSIPTSNRMTLLANLPNTKIPLHKTHQNFSHI
jgi:hypothetical protein